MNTSACAALVLALASAGCSRAQSNASAAAAIAGRSPGAIARAALSATGMVSEVLCSEVFVGGLDPKAVMAETIAPTPGVKLVLPMLHADVDRAAMRVTVTLAGASRQTAVYHAGYGCQLEDGPLTDASQLTPPATAPAPARSDDIAGPGVVQTDDPRLAAALDRAFAEPAEGPRRHVKAVVVVYRGRIIAERYAPGFGPETPMLSWSLAKSVTNALTGVLVRKGRLSLGEPAPIAAWRAAGDARGAITIENLMRMNTGLDLDETNTGFDANSRIMFTEGDMSGYAEQARLVAPVGTRWHYSSPTTLFLVRVIRDQAGENAASVDAFARRELFAPLGMRNVTVEFDRAGDPVGAMSIYASPRDWARFGLLYANDGVAGGRRLLPERWVDYSASPTAGSDEGYAAGFFTARGDARDARSRRAGGMAADAFIASGSLGQRIVIEPKEQLVIVRFERSEDWPNFDAQGILRLVADVHAALGIKG